MGRARISGLSTLAAIAAAGSMIAMKTDASAAEAGAIPPAMSCEALANSDFTALDARIASSATASRNGHPFCDVKGYISPVTQFEALLPTETWRGDYLQQGCGGLCGKADVSSRRSVADQRLPGALCAAAKRRNGRRGGRSRP